MAAADGGGPSGEGLLFLCSFLGSVVAAGVAAVVMTFGTPRGGEARRGWMAGMACCGGGLETGMVGAFLGWKGEPKTLWCGRGGEEGAKLVTV